MTAGSSSDSRRTSEAAAPPSPLDRRAFLTLAARGLAAACLAGCTIPPRSFRAPAGRAVRIPVASYPELERPGGVVKVISPEVDVVFVRREADGGYAALSGTCTHQGCTVAPAADGFRCPCHGSTYDATGNNTGGPARQPLERFKAARDGDAVVLLLETPR